MGFLNYFIIICLIKIRTEIVNLLRAGQPEQAVPLIEKILPIQDEIVKCIEKYME